MSKATAVLTDPIPTYHRPSLRVVASPPLPDGSRSQAITPIAISLGLVLWAAIISAVWQFVQR